MNFIDAIVRLETARALLGHEAVLPPDQVRQIVESSLYGGGYARRRLLSARLQVAWWEAAIAAHRPGSGLPMPVVPEPGCDDVLATHTTCTGQTSLELRWVSDAPESRLEVVLLRHTPIPASRPGRLILTTLVDRLGAIGECPEDCPFVGVEDDADEDAKHGAEIDLVSDPLPESWEPSAVQMAAWLAWQRPELPEWASDEASHALREWARAEGVSLPSLREATDRLRRTLARLSELDGQLVHTPDAGTGPEWDRRNALVHEALVWGTLAGLPVGWGRAQEEDTPAPVVVYLDLPTGQVSWHVPRRPSGLPWYPREWDRHTRPEKEGRIQAWLEPVAA